MINKLWKQESFNWSGLRNNQINSQKTYLKQETLAGQKVFRAMDLRDFKDIYKYKFIMPSLYVLSFITLIFGPYYFPALNQLLCLPLILIASFKFTLFALISFYLLYQNWRVLKRAMSPDSKIRNKVDQEILHAIIIPNYKQDIDVLKETLGVLATHKRAKHTYFVYLAMEKHEQGSDIKAQKLINEFSQKFRQIDYTSHQLRKNEYKGKGSNVGWAAQQMQSKFKALNLPTENLFLTIMDVDSWMPDVYMDQVEDHMSKHWSKRHNYVYEPYQFFTRNQLDVPALTRAYDHIMSGFNAVNTFTFTGFSFAVSNYTVSYNLIKKIGFWDTVEQAIAQDYHFMQKVCWKTRGEAQTVPIYVPFNQLNLETGQGYLADMQARFWQAERHSRMFDDIPYNINMLLKEKLNWKTVRMALITFQTLGSIAFLPMVFLSLMFQQRVLSNEAKLQLLIPQQTMSFLCNIITISTIIFLGVFEIIKRRSTKILFSLKNESILRIFELVALHFPSHYLIMLPTNIYAVFAGLKKNREWFLSLKGPTKKKLA